MSRRASPQDLLPGPRSAGRSRDQIIRHVYLTSPSSSPARSRSGRRSRSSSRRTGSPRTAQAYLDAIRAYNAEGKPARTWPIQFLIRRTAQHVMDHAWEMEDRDPARELLPAARQGDSPTSMGPTRWISSSLPGGGTWAVQSIPWVPAACSFVMNM